jgi:adenosylcobinamide-phosphate synthase
MFIVRYGNKHSSPNAGYPEAALAGILKCRFGGPNVYHGHVVDKPYIGEHDRDITPADIQKAIRINILSVILFTIIMIVGVMMLTW